MIQATRKPAEFQPVTLTLTTQEDLDLLRALSNCTFEAVAYAATALRLSIPDRQSQLLFYRVMEELA